MLGALSILSGRSSSQRKQAWLVRSEWSFAFVGLTFRRVGVLVLNRLARENILWLQRNTKHLVVVSIDGSNWTHDHLMGTISRRFV